MKQWKIRNTSNGAVELPDYHRTLTVGEVFITTKIPQMDTLLLSSGKRKLIEITTEGQDDGVEPKPSAIAEKGSKRNRTLNY